MSEKNLNVCIVIPTYNEKNYIRDVINTLVESGGEYVKRVLVVDGGSTDGTQDIVRVMSEANKNIQLLHNPYRIQSEALNIALKSVQEEVLLRADAHSIYSQDYVMSCLDAIRTTGSWNVGGHQRFVANNIVQAGIGLAVKSILGSGGAKYRNISYCGPAETVYLGCFLTKKLKEMKGYSALPVCEDTELNMRIDKVFKNEMVTSQDQELNLRGGEIWGPVWLSDKIKVWYFPRRTFMLLAIQYFRYGRGRCLVSSFADRNPIRGRLPFYTLNTFIILLTIATLGSVYSKNIIYIILILILPLAFALLCLFEGIRISFLHRREFLSDIWRNGDEKPPSKFFCSLLCGIALLTMNSMHMAGYLYQKLRILFLGKRW